MDKQVKIPVSREVLVDMETPLSIYGKLANCPYSYLFESVEGGDKWARYSLIGLKACLLYTSPSPRDRQKSRMPSSA